MYPPRSLRTLRLRVKYFGIYSALALSGTCPVGYLPEGFIFGILLRRRRGGMADAVDSKSTARECVPVQVWSPAYRKSLWYKELRENYPHNGRS